jgi:hypothetical protein
VPTREGSTGRPYRRASGDDGRRGLSLGDLLSVGYSQVSGVLGAIGIAAVLARVGYHWSGLVDVLVHFWAQTIRPVGAWLFSLPIAFGHWLVGWNLTLPTYVSDYLTIGVIALYAMLRRLLLEEQVAGRYAGYVRRSPRDDFAFTSVILLINFSSILVAFWPVVFCYAAVKFVRARTPADRITAFMMLAPVVYLGLFLVLDLLFG